MRKYLAVVSQFPLYGCTKIFAHYRGVWAYGVETLLAINYDGIKLISIQEKKLAVDIYFSEIEEIVLEVCCQPRHGLKKLEYSTESCSLPDEMQRQVFNREDFAC